MYGEHKILLPKVTRGDCKENKAARANILVYYMPTGPVQHTCQFRDSKFIKPQMDITGQPLYS